MQVCGESAMASLNVSIIPATCANQNRLRIYGQKKAPIIPATCATASATAIWVKTLNFAGDDCVRAASGLFGYQATLRVVSGGDRLY
jgi:hypothetical protein